MADLHTKSANSIGLRAEKVSGTDFDARNVQRPALAFRPALASNAACWPGPRPPGHRHAEHPAPLGEWRAAEGQSQGQFPPGPFRFPCPRAKHDPGSMQLRYSQFFRRLMQILLYLCGSAGMAGLVAVWPPGRQGLHVSRGSAFPPIPQSPLLTSSISTVVTPRMFSPSMETIVSVSLAIISCFCFWEKTPSISFTLISGMDRVSFWSGS